MRNLDDLQSAKSDQGFQFPGAFEITAMGLADVDLEVRIVELLQSIGLCVITGSLRTRPSREGHYLAVSVTFTCPSRELYNAAHAVLRADPHIRWTL